MESLEQSNSNQGKTWMPYTMFDLKKKTLKTTDKSKKHLSQ